MKKFFLPLVFALSLTTAANGQVFINEFMANAPGTDAPLELFELRGTPGMSLAGYYLISLEGQGTTARGDVNQFFDLNTFSLGANGYLVGLQSNAPYSPTIAGATVLRNTISAGWGQVNSTNGSSVGHSSDGTQTDIENSATTILLINTGSGAAPTLTQDLDADDNGFLELPAGWSIADSVGFLEGAGAAATDLSYAAISFRIGTLGGSANGNVIDVAPAGTALYVGRIGESTGSASTDWFGAIPTGSGNSSTFTSSTDPAFNGWTIPQMQIGGVNPVPEPTTLGLLGLGIGAAWLYRRRKA